MISKIRAAIVVLLVVGLAVSGYYGYTLFTEDVVHEPPMSRVSGTTDDGWQQVTYRGVTVEVPPGWARLDMDGCVETTERWGPADVDPCAQDEGLWFRDAAGFDPSSGPGVHSEPTSLNLPDGGWGGYVLRGKVVVDTADADQAVVRRILQSVSQVI